MRIVYTSSLKELVCSLMEFEYATIDSSENVLEFQVLLERFLISIESWKSRTNLCVGGKKSLENVAVLARELCHKQYQIHDKVLKRSIMLPAA